MASTDAGPAFNTRLQSRSMTRDPVLPGAFEATTDEQQSESRPKAAHKSATGKSKTLAREIDFSEHPFYDGEQNAGWKRYYIKSLDELKDLTIDSNEGPCWYKFLSKLNSYDTLLYNKAFSFLDKNKDSKKKLRQYERTNARLAAEKDEEEQQAIRAKEDLEHERLEVAKLREENEALTSRLNASTSQTLNLADVLAQDRREPSATTQLTGTTASAAAAAAAATVKAANWRPRGKDPKELLTGKEPDDYPSWRFAVKKKLKTDSPIYADKDERITYALGQMKAPIFTAMQA